MNSEQNAQPLGESGNAAKPIVRRCTLINEIELVIRIADGATVLKIDEVPAMLSVGFDVFFCSVKKAGKEYEVYIV